MCIVWTQAAPQITEIIIQLKIEFHFNIQRFCMNSLCQTRVKIIGHRLQIRVIFAKSKIIFSRYDYLCENRHISSNLTRNGTFCSTYMFSSLYIICRLGRTKRESKESSDARPVSLESWAGQMSMMWNIRNSCCLWTSTITSNYKQPKDKKNTILILGQVPYARDNTALLNRLTSWIDRSLTAKLRVRLRDA